MDMANVIVAKSDQINASDIVGAPVTITITGVTAGNAEQPVNIHNAEYPDRAYRPSLGMRRLIVAAWGRDSDAYTGRRLELFTDPEVTFGRDKVGGVRISRMSHIEKPLTVALQVARGKKKPYTVQPLPDAPPAPPIPAFKSEDEARAYWLKRRDEGATPDELAAIQAAAPKEGNG